jgi:hypothetical protein
MKPLMIALFGVALLLSVVSLVGCSTPSPLRVFHHKVGEIDPRTRFILVAAAPDSGSFAQEVVDQRDIWIKLGIPAHEIACYFAVPTGEGLNDDVDQFQYLKQKLKNCFLATEERIEADLAKLAKQAKRSLYVYLTSHGQRSEGTDDNYVLLGLEKNFIHAKELNRWFSAFPDATKKYIVLQGCFTGGLLKNSTGEDLRKLKNVLVMTASRADRTSFGCDAGSRVTFFGEAFNNQLRLSGSRPEKMNWNAFEAAVRERIYVSEEALKYSRSEPQFYSNLK